MVADLFLAWSPASMYKELFTSAGAELRKNVVTVLQVGEQAVQALTAQDKLEKMEEWLKALAFLTSVSVKDDHFRVFSR